MKKFLNFNSIAIIFILVTIGLILVLLSTGHPLRSQIMEKAGMAVAQTPTQWNNWQDAAAGNVLHNGVPAVAIYIEDGAGNFIRFTGIGTVTTALSPTIVPGQAAVNGSAGGNLIVPALATRRSLMIRNMGANNILIGPTGLTTTTGFLITVGQTLVLDRSTAAVYAITDNAASNAIVGYLIE